MSYGSYESREAYEEAILTRWSEKVASCTNKQILEAWSVDYGYPHRTRNLAKYWGLPHISSSKIRSLLLTRVSKDELNSISEHIRQNKINRTCEERYGSRSNLGKQTVKSVSSQSRLQGAQTAKAHNISKYGVENVSQLDSVKLKKQQTMSNHGTSYWIVSHNKDALDLAWSKESRNKRSSTNLSKYGCSVAGGSSFCQQKIRQTSLAHYGTLHPMSCSKVSDKRSASLLKRLYSLRGLRVELVQSLFDSYGYTYVGTLSLSDLLSSAQTTTDLQFDVRHSCGRTSTTHFLPKSFSQLIVCPYCKYEYRSNRESLWESKLRSLGLRVEHTRKVISPYEIDLFLPDLMVGLEFNGYYWHSLGHEGGVNSPDYHQRKSQLALEKGIRLYHLWEDISDSFIEKLLFLSVAHKIYARQCELRYCSLTQFYNQFHAHSSPGPCLGFGLFYNGILVAGLTLVKHSNYWENKRYCVHPDYQVVGAFQRLLNAYLKQNDISRVITYCDRDLSPIPTDTVYARNGFIFLGDSGPQLRYFVSKSLPGFPRGVYSRQTFQKHKLLSLFPFFDFNSSETEQQNLSRLGIYPVYNSGTWKYEFIPNKQS